MFKSILVLTRFGAEKTDSDPPDDDEDQTTVDLEESRAEKRAALADLKRKTATLSLTTADIEAVAAEEG